VGRLDPIGAKNQEKKGGEVVVSGHSRGEDKVGRKQKDETGELGFKRRNRKAARPGIWSDGSKPGSWLTRDERRKELSPS